jgi:organic radical activating enzyme
MYKINEIFRSIQGEGINAGRIATFVRFSGCNKSCEWCDTSHVLNSEFILSDLVDKIISIAEPKGLVVLTGGEPALQIDSFLIDSLHHYDFELALETNGSIGMHSYSLARIRTVTVSPKDLDIKIKNGMELKVVNDEGWHESDFKSMQKLNFHHFIIQPCTWQGGTNYKATYDLVMKLGSPWRLGCQMHKIIGCK